MTVPSRKGRGAALRRANGFFLVLTTTGSPAQASRLSRLIVRERAAACVNAVPGVHSRYWWGGKVARDAETLLLIKTGRSQLKRLAQLIRSHHPYDLPELIALPLSHGAPTYLAWLEQSLKP